MLYDLIRNGKAHQYQSPIVNLSDGDFDVKLTGAMPTRTILRSNRRRSRKHLRFNLSTGVLSLYVRTDQLFLDLKSAIQTSGIIQPMDVVTDLKRPRAARPGSMVASGEKPYTFTIATLQSSFVSGGLVPGRL
jgi:hypothetical protein